MLADDLDNIAFRTDGPYLFVKASDTLCRLRPARGSTAITPTSCTYVVTDQSGATVASGSATCASGMASFTMPGATTAAMPAGDGWRVKWLPILPGEAVAREVVNNASLVLRRLHPVISDQDLFDKCSALDPKRPDCITTITDYTSYLASAWKVLQTRLISEGRRPWLIISPEDLGEAHTLLTLAHVFDDLKGRLNPAYADQAKDWREQYGTAWSAVRMLEEAPSASGSTAPAVKRGTKAPVFLGGSRGGCR